MQGGVRGSCRLAEICARDPSFESSILRSVNGHLVLSDVQADVKVSPLRTCQILDFIQYRSFVVYAIGYLAGAKGEVNVEVVDS